ncbi:MAG: hypothetical protein KGL39_56990 [Patescibacteria group bacterium]|nr:hypothetical protein [Patescibacteria group bacterium]
MASIYDGCSSGDDFFDYECNANENGIFILNKGYEETRHFAHIQLNPHEVFVLIQKLKTALSAYKEIIAEIPEE